MSMVTGSRPRHNTGATIFVRSGTSIDGRRRSPDELVNYCVGYCCRHFYNVVAVYTDQGVNSYGARESALPRIEEFCERNRHRASRMIVPRLEGIAKSGTEYFCLVNMMERLNLSLESASGLTVDVQHDGRRDTFMALLEASQYERGSLRTMAGILAARRSGLLTNAPPFGYASHRNGRGDREIVPDPERAHLIAEAFRLVAAGEMTHAEILQHLRGTGQMTSPKGGRLTWMALRRILRNRTYMGQVKISEAEGWIQGCFPALTDAETFEVVQKHLEKAVDGLSDSNKCLHQDLAIGARHHGWGRSDLGWLIDGDRPRIPS
jgi:DNA invertase Pin-like site-specific DNA recombinase